MWSVRPPAIVSVSSPTVSRTNRVCMRMRASFVTSAALEYSPGASSPSGRTKCVSLSPSAAACVVHQLREGRVVRRDRERERVGSIVRRLDQRALDQVADRELVTGVELDRRLADRRGARVDGDDVGELVVLAA